MLLADRLCWCGQIGHSFGRFGFWQRSQVVGNRRYLSFARLSTFCTAQVIATTPTASTAASAAARAAFAIRVLLGARFSVLIVLLVVAFVAVAGFADGVILRRDVGRIAAVGGLCAIARFSTTATPAAAALTARTFTAQENKRYSDLAATGFGSVQNAQNAQARDGTAIATIARDKANLTSAQKQVELLKAELAQAIAANARAKAQQRQAELNLSYTTITAPISGVVGNRTLRVGQFVQAGTQLMSLVPSHGAYIIANYKETQLGNVQAGQPVDVEVDMFPGKAVHGHVDSLAPASGQEFALLPPDNATGNFTKIVQRIPVKIVLDSVDVDLRPGMSVIPSIQTKATIEAGLKPATRQSAKSELVLNR